ncbi:hypothetical protein [Paenarthrobacter sp. NPDC090522]|uniref:hypothetical protein n=1 Tax=Paenarthrobacter sp. NPDC090522 TaxID=3364383 RepID=UPI0037F24313
MASTRKESLAARMAPPPKAAEPQESAKSPKPARTAKTVIDQSFTSTEKEFSKRLTVDITEEQHKKLLLKSVETGKKMNPMIRDWIDSL